MSFLLVHFLFYLLTSPVLVFSQVSSTSDHVDPNDPHIPDLLVSHYDCSKQHNLRQFSLTRVQPCVQAPSAFESTRAIVNVFVRAKAKRLKAWTCEAYVKRKKSSVLNLVINTAVMIALIIIKILWNAPALLILLNANMLFAI